jgi:hypothetical protein
MNRIPPSIVRRLVVAPLVVAICLVLVVASPLALAVAGVHDLLVDRRWRAIKVVTFTVVYLAFEVVSILAMLVLWLAAGADLRIRSPGMQQAHYRYMAWWLKRMNSAAARLFGVRVEIEDAPAPQPGPVLVFSRHAGPGNSLLLMGALMLIYKRRPRVVMLAKLQWDPFFDMLGHRTPNSFIQHDPSRREEYVRAIAGLAAGTGDHDAFTLFPEGRDFTPRLRLRAIESLRKLGHHDSADKAELMKRVLPPRPGGVAAAVTAAPEADVVFVAHTVLEDIGSFHELWSRIPLSRPVVARYWRIPAGEVPRQTEELIEWLFRWWARIDEWIALRTDSAVGPAAVSVAEGPAGPGLTDGYDASGGSEVAGVGADQAEPPPLGSIENITPEARDR